MDGGTQHLPRVYWISRAFLSTDLYEFKTILAYISNFGTEEIDQMARDNAPWASFLPYMRKRLDTEKLRPTYLLMYKEMMLNFHSYKAMADHLVWQYHNPTPRHMKDTMYYKVFYNEVDKPPVLQYNYNDGKNAIKIWRLC